jgi:tetratricopeptide (TPR) repeat protein
LLKSVSAQTSELDTLKDDFNIGAVPKLTASKPFIGREEKLSELLDMLSPRSHKESDSRIVVLHAPTGSGKTSLALECCQRNEKLFSTIFWINANSVQSIQSSYATFAKALTEHYVTQLADPFNSYDAVYRHLGLSDLVNDKTREDGFDQIAGTPLVDAINVWFSQVCNTDWLMVLDNIDESDITIIKEFFPTPVLGHILVITRLDGYAEKHGYPVVELGNMTRVESQKLLMSLIHAHDSDKGLLLRCSLIIPGRLTLLPDNALALTVVDGCNSPLSIAQAANFINTISLSLQEYLDMTETTNHKWSLDLWDSYDETKVGEILNAQQPWSNDQWNSYSDPTVTAYSSWADKIEQLQSSDRTAFDLLTLCSFFAKDMIPVALLEEAVTASSLEEGRRLEDILEDLDRRSLITRQSCIASRKSRDNDAISSISGRDSPELLFPMLERSSGNLNFLFRQPSPSEVANCISIHPLVHSWAQKRLYPVAQGVMAERAFKALALAIQSSNIPPSDLIGLDKFLPHLKSCLESVDMVDGDPKSDVKWSVLADVCRYQGLHDRARQFYEFSLKRVEAETVLVTSRIEASSVRMRLGFVYVQQKHLDKAETEYKKAMNHILAAKRETGNRDDNTKIANLELRIFASLASLYKTQNRFEEAEARYYSILPRFEEVWGSEDIRTLLLLEQFASCLLANGNLEEAEALYRRVLVSYVKEFGRDYPTVAKIQQKLAKTLQLKGKYEHAEGFLQQALTATEKRLGKEHPETVKLLVFFAQLKCFCRKFNEAEKIYLELLNSQTTISGSSNAASLELRVNLGMTYQAQKKYADAEAMYQKALDDLKNQKDKSLQHEKELMLKLKALYEEIGAADKVKQLLGEILEKFPQVPL